MGTVADTIVQTLVANGVQRVYGLPGDSLNAFTEAIRTEDRMEWVGVRHEETAAFAAGAEAEMTGELAVCAGSCGPGNLHLINGLFDANRSRVPVLAIAAHIPTVEIGTNYFQETHPQELFRECSVYVEYVADAAQMPRLLEIAMRAAIEQRGVAVLVIPGDVASATIEDDRHTIIRRTQSATVPLPVQLLEAADVLNRAKKVTILGGAGTAGAHAEVLAAAERLGAPVVHAMRGKEHLEYDNPYDVGMTGLLGFASGYRAMSDADAVLLLGTDFPYPQFYPDDARFVQIDIRGSQIGRRHPIDVALQGGVRETLVALMPHLEQKQDRHLKDAQKHYGKTREKLDDLAAPARKGQAVHPQYLARRIDALAADDAVFIPDVGSPVVYASRYLTMNGKRRMLGSFSHGSMANAVPQAIGVLGQDRARQTVTLSGDGGLAMLLGDLLTLTQNRLPAKIVVFNNSSLNFVDLEMKAAGFVPFATDLENPSFAAVAEAMGIKGIRVEDSAGVDAALTEAFAHDGPTLVDVVCDPQELTIPPAIAFEQAKGFALYAIRTVLSGRGDELLDLARTNWRQLF
ncbi:ubiquinone-dependent pyruvate dehydrogenase [Agrococcus sp. ARC_14]|uniref:ubiquinone-dependent pyruvate dehydrogenase n=1 Tax=Agrococcus sp. ARC_14 TaxID=2919927 RepID=UPI001F05616A|nr:ubiquinone-dependent pyruvate dehydrogenase [Agrococcus sp. ARC_14]MCH1884044.1 ubiquinone-dependent pyruvate dehydrogenase [Agrococcus sp. ARC_14]